jgi:hypothetical protein
MKIAQLASTIDQNIFVFHHRLKQALTVVGLWSDITGGQRLITLVDRRLFDFGQTFRNFATKLVDDLVESINLMA